jgi:hypothetical protein
VVAPPPEIRELDDAAPGEVVPVRSPSGRRSISTMPPSPLTPTPMDVRTSLTSDDGYGDPRFSSLAPSRRTGVGRWIVGLVVAGLAALTLVTLGPRYLKPSAPAPAKTSDVRVANLLDEGERSLIDGDLETARDKLVKASGLAEDDPRVAAGLARLETISADVRWLRLRLLAENDPERDVAKRDLDAAVGRAQVAVDHA